jgi:hypothetical protein
MSAYGRSRALTAASVSPPLNFVIRRTGSGRPATATAPPTSNFWRMRRRRPAIALRAGYVRLAHGRAIRLRHSDGVFRKSDGRHPSQFLDRSHPGSANGQKHHFAVDELSASQAEKPRSEMHDDRLKRSANSANEQIVHMYMGRGKE